MWKFLAGKFYQGKMLQTMEEKHSLSLRIHRETEGIFLSLNLWMRNFTLEKFSHIFGPGKELYSIQKFPWSTFYQTGFQCSCQARLVFFFASGKKKYGRSSPLKFPWSTFYQQVFLPSAVSIKILSTGFPPLSKFQLVKF